MGGVNAECKHEILVAGIKLTWTVNLSLWI